MLETLGTPRLRHRDQVGLIEAGRFKNPKDRTWGTKKTHNSQNEKTKYGKIMLVD